MNCEHPINALVGTADGIKCNICGRLFLSLDDVMNDTAPSKPKKPKKEKPTDE